MKRERFVKLLMARGHSRNEANSKAEDARRNIGDYDSAMRLEDLEEFFTLNNFTIAIGAISDAMKNAATGVLRLVDDLASLRVSIGDLAHLACSLNDAE